MSAATTAFSGPRGASNLDEFVVSEPCCGRSHGGAHDAECAFRVAWSINPHMKIGTVDPNRARKQHDAFVELLEDLGARIHRVPFVHGAYDSVFAKDNAVLRADRGGKRALLARPRYAERRAEQAARRRSLIALGFVVTECTEPLEGGDVVVLPAGAAFLGNGFRSSAAAARPLGQFLGARVTPLELVDERLYHLDTALAVLRDGTALVCKEAFTRDSLATLRRSSDVARIVEVPFEEAIRFGTNLVQVGSSVVLGGPAPRTEGALRALGLDVHIPDLDSFRNAGGSAACLVARIHPQHSTDVLTSAA